MTDTHQGQEIALAPIDIVAQDNWLHQDLADRVADCLDLRMNSHIGDIEIFGSNEILVDMAAWQRGEEDDIIAPTFISTVRVDQHECHVVTKTWEVIRNHPDAPGHPVAVMHAELEAWS